MTPSEQAQKKKRRTVHSISFKEEDLKIIQLAAQQEGVSFASFLKYATLEYIKESLEYQRLVSSGEMDQGQKEKTATESMGALEETVKNTLLSMHESIQYQLRVIRWYAQHGLYYQFYYNQVVPAEDRESKAKLAKIRMDNASLDLAKELKKEDFQKIEQKNRESQYLNSI